MAESVFEAVKQSVTVREAAQMYGIEVNRNGMACCPFHDDKNPSMKLNEEYFYCFGCGATGDVIDFTARLYNLSPKEAAEKLAQDFGLEDDYGMIDGIINNGPKEPTVAQLEQQARSGQPISLMDLAAATHREEREKKKSVMEQLKSQPKAEHKKTAPKKSAEREL